MKYKVTSETPIWIKQTPSLTGKNIGLLHTGDIIEAIKEINGYIQISQGYVLKNLSNLTEVEETVTLTTSVASPLLATSSTSSTDADDISEWDSVEDITNWAKIKTKMTLEEAAKAQANVDNPTATSSDSTTDSTQKLVVVHLDDLMKSDSTKQKLMFSNVNGIYGMPYQWHPLVDPRVTGNEFSPGRIYTEKIISKIPLLLISPGGPHYNATGGQSIYELVTQEGVLGADLSKTELNQNEGIFYSFEYDLVQYFTYVNPILRLAAKCLGIESRTLVPSSGGSATSLENFDWSLNYNKSIHGNDARTDWVTKLGSTGDTSLTKNERAILNDTPYTGARSLAFYLESDFSQTDSISNSTQESSLKAVNEVSSKINEMRFLLGMGSAAAFKDVNLAEKGSNMAKTAIETMQKKYGANRFVSNLLNTANTIMEGGKLMFPSIWGDSSFNARSYEVKFKFVSPDYDTFSWYLNIMVPLVHLICLTFPRKGAGSFSYTAPFLVRAFCKGLFNCDLGLITGLNINRGQECGWTQSGLPTIVEVSMTIQDLYEGMAMSRSDIGGTAGMFAILKNPIYLDFIANMCGLNLNEPDVRRLISFYRILAKGAVSDLPKTITGNVEQWWNNTLLNIFGKMQRAGL